jgi:ribosomal protein S18 acetylase RimI-like enzyme
LTGPRASFRAERYAIGAARDGRGLALAPLRAEIASAIAREIATFGPWTADHYAIDPEALAASLVQSGDGAVRYEILCGAETAGLLVVRSPWLSGPYLQLLAVLPRFQGCGIGARVLAWLEAEARGLAPNVWLCVSAFNTRAADFYRRHGFVEVARIDALLKPHIDELLMRKRL